MIGVLEAYLKKKMDSFQLFLLFVIIFFYFQPSISVGNCRFQCGSQTIRFPFRLIDQPDNCSYPGFKLSCEVGEGQVPWPTLTLPYVGNFSVYKIDYVQQILQIDYPEGCIPRILLLQGLNLSGSPFASAVTRSYTFFNCSSHAPMVEYPLVTKIMCLSGLEFYVVATRTDNYIPPTSLCSEIAKVLVPIPPTDWSVDLNYGLILGWTEPDCRWCETHRGTCLRKNVGDGRDVGCYGAFNSGLSTSAKYALLFGVATPIVCLLAIISCHRIKFIQWQDHPHPEILMSITFPRSTSAANGLGRRTIDAYPTTLLGQSRRLPNPNDNTCSICLCEYQANETLRTIPNCNHYFHVDCIDQWLMLNATCPICRDKFEESAASVTATLSSSRPVVRLML